MSAGAPPVKPQVKALNCPGCGAALTVRSFNNAVTIVCDSCHSILDAKDPNLQILQRFKVATGEDKPLALGNARLAGLDAPPTIDPPATRLRSGLQIDLRLTFAGVTDAVAEAAVLVLAPKVELQAYSEDLQ